MNVLVIKQLLICLGTAGTTLGQGQANQPCLAPCTEDVCIQCCVKVPGS